MHKKRKIRTNGKIAFFWKKVLLTGSLFILLSGCTGCGKKETELFLEETFVQPVEEQSNPEESGKAVEEQQNSVEENMTEQAENTTVPGSCFVHVCGAVERPGVYELPEGSRIYEAVELAGGLTEEACGEYQNQAEKITDGMKIYIPTAEQLEEGGNAEVFWKEETKESQDAKDTDGAVNINIAGKELLMTLPGIGESRAESIIAYREQCGGFDNIEDIMQVSGIKQGAYEKLKDKICVD